MFKTKVTIFVTLLLVVVLLIGSLMPVSRATKVN